MKEEKKSINHLDNSLRPSTWDTYIGQETIKKNLHILLEAAKQRNQPADHLLFYGPPGTGKTALCKALSIASGRFFFLIDSAEIYSTNIAATLSNLRRAFDEVSEENELKSSY